MPIQPLEVYDVEETGELVIKHISNLQDELIPHKVLMIVNHNDKTIALWVGTGASTRAKFAGARSSRRFLTERGLSYRVRTCDEGDEPDWFQDLFNIRAVARCRDEPPTLEVLSILNEMKIEDIPEGYEREACIISRDFFVPVEHKSSIMGKDTSTIKFEKSSYIPEGFFTLPSESYRPRLLVRNGKILAIDLLVNAESTQKEVIIERLEQELKEQSSQIKVYTAKITQLDALQVELQTKSERLERSEQANTEKSNQIETIQQERNELEEKINELAQKNRAEEQKVASLEQDLSQKIPRLEALEKENKEGIQKIEGLVKDLTESKQQISRLQEESKANTEQIMILKNEISQKITQVEQLEQENLNFRQRTTEESEEIENLKREMTEHQTLISNLKQEILTKEQKISKLEEERAGMMERIENLENSLEQTERKAAGYQQKLAKVENENKQMESLMSNKQLQKLAELQNQ